MNIAKEVHDDRTVFVNKDTDDLRRTECLCLNCEIKDKHKCIIASTLYDTCVFEDLAIMITRCPNFKRIKK